MACAKRLLHKVYELAEDGAHLLAPDKLASVQRHVEERIAVLQTIHDHLHHEDAGRPQDSDLFGTLMPVPR